MGNQLLASKVVIVEEEPRIRNSRAATAVSARSHTERGPVGQPVLCKQPEEFATTFGGFTQNSDVALAIMPSCQWRQTVWVVRTVHYTDVTDPTEN